jgi:hypothetical protein
MDCPLHIAALSGLGRSTSRDAHALRLIAYSGNEELPRRLWARTALHIRTIPSVGDTGGARTPWACARVARRYLGRVAITRAQLEQRRLAPLRHGGCSPTRIAAQARAHRRRFLRRAGLKAGDLDAVALELLNLWARGTAQLDLRERGGADASKDYWVSFNATRRVLERLDQRLRDLALDRRGRDPLDALIAMRESL